MDQSTRREFDWALLRIPESDTESGKTSPEPYSSAGHDGLTDAEWEIGEPGAQPQTPAGAVIAAPARVADGAQGAACGTLPKTLTADLARSTSTRP